MEKVVTIARKWGNSLGVTLSKEVVEKEKIRPNDEVVITVTKVAPIKELFGTFKTNKTTEEMRKESKKGWR